MTGVDQSVTSAKSGRGPLVVFQKFFVALTVSLAIPFLSHLPDLVSGTAARQSNHRE